MMHLTKKQGHFLQCIAKLHQARLHSGAVELVQVKIKQQTWTVPWVEILREGVEGEGDAEVYWVAPPLNLHGYGVARFPVSWVIHRVRLLNR